MKNRIQIWTDGSCPLNRGLNPGGWASILLLPEEFEKTFDEKVVINNNNGKLYKCIEISGNDEKTTSNRMEFKAVIEGIKKSVKLGFNTVSIFSDSKYVVNTGSRWMYKWEKRNWSKSGDGIKNLDLIKELYNLCTSNNISFTWIKGHSGNFLNERADELAGIESSKLM